MSSGKKVGPGCKYFVAQKATKSLSARTDSKANMSRAVVSYKTGAVDPSGHLAGSDGSSKTLA